MQEDRRTATERLLWERLGPPLYYCERCMLRVDVDAQAGKEPTIIRRCEHSDAPIIAPRKAIAAGAGGLTTRNKLRLTIWQLMATLTGRTV